ncbi:hypothetical protein OUZ56_013588 [Daphnia magna]|uniref:Uncharacterized protein n=1 Tax=Daphnia magna TaxID=35525 RepID=A0ABQ9Z6C0_9CRUS|nr:hypothetical protein OUZ56_013588 [Daphnia magna]
MSETSNGQGLMDSADWHTGHELLKKFTVNGDRKQEKVLNKKILYVVHVMESFLCLTGNLLFNRVFCWNQFSSIFGTWNEFVNVSKMRKVCPALIVKTNWLTYRNLETSLIYPFMCVNYRNVAGKSTFCPYFFEQFHLEQLVEGYKHESKLMDRQLTVIRGSAKAAPLSSVVNNPAESRL